MPLLSKPLQIEPKRNLTIRLEPELIEELSLYCEFLGAGRQTVIRQALRYAFENDREFQLWRHNSLANGHGA